MAARISRLGRGCGALGAERENKTSKRVVSTFCPLLDPPRFGISQGLACSPFRRAVVGKFRKALCSDARLAAPELADAKDLFPHVPVTDIWAAPAEPVGPWSMRGAPSAIAISERFVAVSTRLLVDLPVCGCCFCFALGWLLARRGYERLESPRAAHE